MRFLCLAAVLTGSLTLATPGPSRAQMPTFGAAEEIPLYPGIAPGSEDWDQTESTVHGASGPRTVNVVRPTLLHFPAPNGIGTAMIVAPGGGNRMLMMSYEGVDIARKLNEFGVDAFVLKYRLKYTGPPSEDKETEVKRRQVGENILDFTGADGCRAVQLVRSQAAEFNIRSNRIGMIGFSAGGGPIRAAMHGAAESRPNFVALIYAARTKEGPERVPAATAPPLFLAVAADDQAFLQSSIDTFSAWHAAGIAAELHIFQMGAHGFVNKGGGADYFMDRVEEWMRTNEWLTPK